MTFRRLLRVSPVGLDRAMTESAYGQRPPDVVNSDSNFNTAMGTSALLNLAPDKYGNTAAGYEVLYSYTAAIQGRTRLGGPHDRHSGRRAAYSQPCAARIPPLTHPLPPHPVFGL
jgi:hypothetical protein